MVSTTMVALLWGAVAASAGGPGRMTDLDEFLAHLKDALKKKGLK